MCTAVTRKPRGRPALLPAWTPRGTPGTSATPRAGSTLLTQMDPAQVPAPLWPSSGGQRPSALMAFSSPQDPLQAPDLLFTDAPAWPSPKGRCSGPAAPVLWPPRACPLPSPHCFPGPSSLTVQRLSHHSPAEDGGHLVPLVAARGRHASAAGFACLRASTWELGQRPGGWLVPSGFFERTLPGAYREPALQARRLRPETGRCLPGSRENKASVPKFSLRSP